MAWEIYHTKAGGVSLENANEAGVFIDKALPICLLAFRSSFLVFSYDYPMR